MTITITPLTGSIGGLVEKHQHDVGPGLADRLEAVRIRLEGLSIDDQIALAGALETIAEPRERDFEAIPASGSDSSNT